LRARYVPRFVVSFSSPSIPSSLSHSHSLSSFFLLVILVDCCFCVVGAWGCYRWHVFVVVLVIVIHGKWHGRSILWIVVARLLLRWPGIGRWRRWFVGDFFSIFIAVVLDRFHHRRWRRTVPVSCLLWRCPRKGTQVFCLLCLILFDCCFFASQWSVGHGWIGFLFFLLGYGIEELVVCLACLEKRSWWTVHLLLPTCYMVSWSTILSVLYVLTSCISRVFL
jgi:hypothetical protein